MPEFWALISDSINRHFKIFAEVRFAKIFCIPSRLPDGRTAHVSETDSPQRPVGAAGHVAGRAAAHVDGRSEGFSRQVTTFLRKVKAPPYCAVLK